MRTKLPNLATAKAEEDRQTQARGILSGLAALLGLTADDATPDAKMSKRTETTKHVVMEESDDDDMEAEDDDCAEEAEAEEDEESTGSTGSGGAPTKAEEEEEKAISKAYAAADKAFAKAVRDDPGLLLRRPSALLREAMKATGQGGASATMGALSGLRATIRAQEKTAERVGKLETESRETRVNNMLAKAARAGKVTRAEVTSLKAQGMKDPAWLKGHLAILPAKVRTTEDGPLVPREGADGTTALGALTPDQENILKKLTGGMKPEEEAAFRAEFTKRLQASANHPANSRPRS